MPNRLAQSESLYLRQHADNPVDWFPWGDEALAEARRRDVPILVSIGYSACHWCHVMAHESFEDEGTARLMNARYVCVKVDREEHPDVDAVYMEAVQMMNQGHGGWPLNVFCLPDGRPFAGGTYFPPEDRGQGLVPWPTLLLRVAEAYQRQKEDLLQNAEAVTQNLSAANLPRAGEGEVLDGAKLLAAADDLLQEHDHTNGGFGGAPKFPLAMALGFLLDLRRSKAIENDDTRARGIDFVLRRSLDAMAKGGLYDQVGGGFFRYCVDADWMIPHFEKMLYDNALLLELYARAWTRMPDRPLWRAVAEETATWLQREMAVGGAFAAAVDADSGEGEGAYYIWKPGQLTEVLGREEAERFGRAYGVTASGNFEGATHLQLSTESFQEREKFTEARHKLLAKRKQRPAPGRDDKRLLAWNAYAVRGLASAAFAFEDESLLEAAVTTLASLESAFATKRGLAHVVYANGPQGVALLEDVAALAEAHLALAERIEAFRPGTSAEHLARATELADLVLTHFGDEEPGFFTTPRAYQSPLPRKKAWFDNATPSGQSSLLHVLLGLHAITGEDKWRKPVDALRPIYASLAEEASVGLGHALSAFTQEAMGIAVVHASPREGEEAHTPTFRERLRTFAAELARRPWRRCFLLPGTPGTHPAGFQVCVGPQCQTPVEDPVEAAHQI